jgi:bifunctional DNA-binding transcriptional regulator/antitoxin component of YhaV-PrlF toxin-antitoxin module
LADGPANGNFYAMKTSIDHAGRLLIPKEICRKPSIKPGMPLEVRWEKGAIAITPAPLPVKLRRKGRLLVAIRLKNGPSLSTKTVNSTRKAQRKCFWRLFDRVHKEGIKKGFTKRAYLPD